MKLLYHLCFKVRREPERIQVFNGPAFKIRTVESIWRVPSVLPVFHHQKIPGCPGLHPPTSAALDLKLVTLTGRCSCVHICALTTIEMLLLRSFQSIIDF